MRNKLYQIIIQKTSGTVTLRYSKSLRTSIRFDRGPQPLFSRVKMNPSPSELSEAYRKKMCQDCEELIPTGASKCEGLSGRPYGHPPPGKKQNTLLDSSVDTRLIGKARICVTIIENDWPFHAQQPARYPDITSFLDENS